MNYCLNGDIYLRRKIPSLILDKSDVKKLKQEINRIIDTGNRTQKSISMRSALEKLSKEMDMYDIYNSLYEVGDTSYVQEFYALDITCNYKLISVTEKYNRDIIEYNNYNDLSKDFISLYEVLNTGNYVGKIYLDKDSYLPIYIVILYEKDGICLTETLDLFFNHIMYIPQQLNRLLDINNLEFKGELSHSLNLSKTLYRKVLKEVSEDAKGYNKKL